MRWSCVLVLLFLLVQGYSCLFNFVKCRFYECCVPEHLPNDFDQLEAKLERNLYGQPLVKKTLVSALKSHLSLSNPKKALVISFHGSTGVGKNFVSQFVADAMFSRGVKSKYFKMFVATKDFPHNQKIDEYKEKIIKTIESTVKECHTSLFVFDEIDKIPLGLIDTLKAYIDFYQDLDGMDFRRSVFIFLSNTGATEIAKMTLNLDHQNIDREKFVLKEFQNELQHYAYYSENAESKGMARSVLIESFLIDYFVPFLPLEREHVKQCAKAEIKKFRFHDGQRYDQRQLELDADFVADEMIYEPAGYNKFSSAGCKRVPQLVRKLIVERGYKEKEEL